uniref:uncharacterized protein LOC122608704 n=1 Tax=Erigeron canadensis TaxID=72917 RepID=UPI001CB8EA61|nr:uncharacterized protein LOC122608704 [Erigeron canadensis]
MEKNTTSRSSYNRGNFQRSNSISSRFCSSSISSRPMSSFSSASRSTSPTRINIRKSCITPTYLVQFSLDHCHKAPGSSVVKNISDRNNNNSIINSNGNIVWSHGSRKTCLCSPTTHPGSFRCSLHKNSNNGARNLNGSSNENNDLSNYRSHRLYARRSAMTNSLVRIGTVEGDLVKRALASLIRPSSHQQRRRNDFQRRPSRLSLMSKAEE